MSFAFYENILWVYGIFVSTPSVLIPFSALVSDDEETMSEMAYPSRRSRFSQSGRSSSRAMLPLNRLETLTEAPSVNMMDESSRERGRTGRGMSRINSSVSDSRVPTPRRHLDSRTNGSSVDHRNEHNEAEEEQPSSPPPAWAAEPRDSDNNGARNALLRRPQWNPKKP